MSLVAFKTVYSFLALGALPGVLAGLSRVLAGPACVQRNRGRHDCVEKCERYSGFVIKTSDSTLSTACGLVEYVLPTTEAYHRNRPNAHTGLPSLLVHFPSRGLRPPTRSETKLWLNTTVSVHCTALPLWSGMEILLLPLGAGYLNVCMRAGETKVFTEVRHPEDCPWSRGCSCLYL